MICGYAEYDVSNNHWNLLTLTNATKMIKGCKLVICEGIKITFKKVSWKKYFDGQKNELKKYKLK